MLLQVEYEAGLVMSVLLEFYVSLVLHVQSVHWDCSRTVDL